MGCNMQLSLNLLPTYNVIHTVRNYSFLLQDNCNTKLDRKKYDEKLVIYSHIALE